jgi:hypothetical protein
MQRSLHSRQCNPAKKAHWRRRKVRVYSPKVLSSARRAAVAANRNLSFSRSAVSAWLLLATGCASAHQDPPRETDAGSGGMLDSASAPSCEQRQQLVKGRLDQVASAADRVCQVDNDCRRVSASLRCADACSEYTLSEAGERELEAARSRLELDVCTAFEADGCKSLALPCEPLAGSPRCFAGDCLRADTVTCGATSVCVISEDGGMPRLVPQRIESLCTGQLLPQKASAGLYQVCLVGPDGSLFLTIAGGSNSYEMDGFTHSAYGGGNIHSTLSPADEPRCTEIKALAAPGTPTNCN